MQVAIYTGTGAKRQVGVGPIKQIIGRMRPLLRCPRHCSGMLMRGP